MQDHSPIKSLPPFSPMLLASLALQPLPVKLFSPIVSHILNRIEILYPEIFDRLKPLGLCTFCIIPTDFHCRFLATLDDGKPSMEILENTQPAPETDATISGPMMSLIKLLEGRVDGDALFFSRELTVEGDTEAVLTLRNAVDSVDISLDQVFLGNAGPLKPIAKTAITKFSSLYQRAHDDLDLLRNSLLAPLSRKVSLQDEDLDRQEDRFKQIEKEIRRMKASIKRQPTPSEGN